MRNHYRALRDKILTAIKDSALRDHVEIREEDSGLHFQMAVETNRTDAEMVERAKALSVRIACLSQYYSDSACAKNGIVILNYAGVPEGRAAEAVRRIASAII